MWVCIAERRLSPPRLWTQPGSWECQTSVWPRSCIPWLAACSAIRSPLPKVKLPWEGWTASHFISFSAVTLLNSAFSVAA